MRSRSSSRVSTNSARELNFFLRVLIMVRRCEPVAGPFDAGREK